MVAKQKYQIGDTVRFVGDKDHEAGEVVGFSYNAEQGFTYQITAKEVDFSQKKVVDGVKTCSEDELVKVELEK